MSRQLLIGISLSTVVLGGTIMYRYNNTGMHINVPGPDVAIQQSSERVHGMTMSAGEGDANAINRDTSSSIEQKAQDANLTADREPGVVYENGRLHINVRGVPLRMVLEEIRKKVGFQVVGVPDGSDTNLVSMRFSGNVSEGLRRLLKDYNYLLDYRKGEVVAGGESSGNARITKLSFLGANGGVGSEVALSQEQDRTVVMADPVRTEPSPGSQSAETVEADASPVVVSELLLKQTIHSSLTPNVIQNVPPNPAQTVPAQQYEQGSVSAEQAQLMLSDPVMQSQLQAMTLQASQQVQALADSLHKAESEMQDQQQ